MAYLDVRQSFLTAVSMYRLHVEVPAFRVLLHRCGVVFSVHDLNIHILYSIASGVVVIYNKYVRANNVQIKIKDSQNKVSASPERMEERR